MGETFIVLGETILVLGETICAKLIMGETRYNRTLPCYFKNINFGCIEFLGKNSVIIKLKVVCYRII